MKPNEDPQIETGIGPVTDTILKYFVDILSTNKFKKTLTNNVIDPTTKIISNKIRPYIYVGAGLYTILLILIIIIIILLIKKK